MTPTESLQIINCDPTLSTEAEVQDALTLIAEVDLFSQEQSDMICDCYQRGPIHDGDLTSAVARDLLVRGGYLSRVVMRGDEGYNACTYRGASAYQLIVTRSTIESRP